MKALDVLGLPIASDMGLFLEPRPKPMMKRVFVLGLPMKTLGSDLSCSPGLILCLVLDLGLGLWIEFYVGRGHGLKGMGFMILSLLLLLLLLIIIIITIIIIIIIINYYYHCYYYYYYYYYYH